MSHLLAPGLPMSSDTSSINLVGFQCERERRVWQCAETCWLVAGLAPLWGFTVCNLSIDSLGASINSSIKVLVFEI